MLDIAPEDPSAPAALGREHDLCSHTGYALVVQVMSGESITCVCGESIPCVRTQVMLSPYRLYVARA